MKLAAGQPLSVGLAQHTDTDPFPAGRLALHDGLAQLEWSSQLLARGLALSPLHYPPEPGLHAARGRAFGGLHAFLADSLPEGWGHLLMRRRLAGLGIDIATLSILERLALVGDQGRGALVFRPATTPDDLIASLDLDQLAEEAALLLAGEESTLADTLAGLAGGSGGARPKVHVGFGPHGSISVGSGETAPGHAAWIVKFPAPDDPPDIGPIETAYADMAGSAGLDMSAHQLIPARRGPGYFATRRFDRPDGGGRIHMVSLAGAIEAPSDRPSTSYDTFLRATLAITRRTDDVVQAFRRMVFNILASNRDDHTRQHAYLMDETGGWRLAPAYDLTWSQGPGGEHYMDVEGEGRTPTRAHVLALGRRHGLGDRRIGSVIEETRAGVAAWPELARAAGVTAASLNTIQASHRRVEQAFIGKA